MDLKYWGAIAPVADTVLWQGRMMPVEFHIMSAKDELEILALAGNGPPEGIELAHPDQRDYLETYYRSCRALYSLGGDLVEETYRERLILFATWLDPCIWELRDAYRRCQTKLITEEQAFFADPLPEARSAEPSGDDSGPPATLPIASSPRRKRSSSSITPTSTSGRAS